MPEQWADTADHALAAESGRWADTSEHSPAPASKDSILSGMWDQAKGIVKGAAAIGNQINSSVDSPAARILGPPGAAIDMGWNVLKGAANASGEQFHKAGQDFGKGSYVDATRHALGGAVPMVGPEFLGDRGDEMQTAPRTAIGKTVVGGLALMAPESPYVAAAGRGLKTAGKEIVADTLGATTGVGRRTMHEAMENPGPDLTSAMRGHTTDLEIVSHAKDAVQNIRDARRTDYQQALRALPNVTLDITPIRQAEAAQLRRFNVDVGANGDLDFSRSTLRDPQSQGVVSSIHDDLKGWGSRPGDLSPYSVDILKQRIDDLYAPNGNARAFSQAMKDSTRSVLDKNVPGYQKMTDGYAKASQFLDQLKDLSIEGKNPGTAIRKLTTSLKQNNQYREVLLDALNKYAATNIPGEIAGRSLSAATPRGVTGPISGAGLVTAIATHMVTPHAALAAAMASPRLMGEMLVAMSKASPMIGTAAAALPKAAIAAQLSRGVLPPPPGSRE